MEIDFDKMQGLAPAVIQDAGTGELLMVGFMNKEAWTRRCTLDSSRSIKPHPPGTWTRE